MRKNNPWQSILFLLVTTFALVMVTKGQTSLQQSNDFVSFNNLGIRYSSEGHYDKAVEAYRRALSIRPDLAEVTSTWALPFTRQAASMRRFPLSSEPPVLSQITPRLITTSD